MATWKFTDQYQATYPALQNSIFSLLAFSSNTTLTPGTASQPFSGTLDVAATGAALTTLGNLLSVTQLDVSGTVTEAANTLTVTLTSTAAMATQFQQGVATCIPLIAKHITTGELSIQTIVATTDDSDDAPPTDVFDLSVTLTIGSTSATLTAQVPMHDGLFSLIGTFTGVGVGLADLDFLMGSLAGSDHSWFPTQQLGPYAQSLTTLSLLTLALTANVTHQPSFAIEVSSVAACIGIPQLPLMGKALYLNPLGVWVTVADPTRSPVVAWGLEGTIALYNYAATNVPMGATPDFTFDFAMGFPTAQNANFSLSGTWEISAAQPGPPPAPPLPTVSLIIQDLLGESADVGISDKITLTAFKLETTADVKTGTITDFATDLTLSTGFGLFDNLLKPEEISLAVTYSGS